MLVGNAHHSKTLIGHRTFLSKGVQMVQQRASPRHLLFCGLCSVVQALCSLQQGLRAGLCPQAQPHQRVQHLQRRVRLLMSWQRKPAKSQWHTPGGWAGIKLSASMAFEESTGTCLMRECSSCC